MTDKATSDLIDEAARRIAQDIISGDLTANERVKAFQSLISYHKEIALPAPSQEDEDKPVDFDVLRSRLHAVTNGASSG